MGFKSAKERRFETPLNSVPLMSKSAPSYQILKPPKSVKVQSLSPFSSIESQSKSNFVTWDPIINDKNKHIKITYEEDWDKVNSPIQTLKVNPE